MIQETHGELEICELCGGSPHVLGCPYHPRYDDDRYMYERVDATDDKGPASYWVDDTFAAAARSEGLDEDAALREGVEEFARALRDGELRRV